MSQSEHFDLDSFQSFTSELAQAGFTFVPDSRPHRWIGRIHPAFESLTDADTMLIVIQPGWPFQPPVLLVPGLDTSHSTADGFVCLWQDGDFSLEWTTLDGLNRRIQEWCDEAINRWRNDDLAQDALLNFQRRSRIVATFDLDSLGIRSGGRGEFYGSIPLDRQRVDIEAGRRRSSDQLRGMWFHVGSLSRTPPRNLDEVENLLPRPSRRTLKRELSKRKSTGSLAPSGGLDLVLFGWQRRNRTHLLVLAFQDTPNGMEAVALQPGPKDEKSLIMRAGPDARALRRSKAVVFGAGALGGHTSTLLAESGVGSLHIVDPDVLLPENVVRHVAGHDQVGALKAEAVKSEVANHAPWCLVKASAMLCRTPDEILQPIADSDIVVDTTGNEALVYSISQLAVHSKFPYVSGALYRGGSIARVQRQDLSSDVPINQREPSDRYPLIPAGNDAEEFAEPHLGCSAPANNAPPASVAACAALIAQVAIDALLERHEFDDEIIDVYRPLSNPPFDRAGRVVRGPA